MDEESEGRDGASLDPELLQLQEVSSVALKDYPHVAEQLYQQWLVMPETVRLVTFRFSCVGVLLKLFGFYKFLGLIDESLWYFFK